MDNHKLAKIIFYQNRHFIKYVIIGIFSIFCELMIRNFLLKVFDYKTLINIISFLSGLSIAFILNFKFNFKIKKNFFLKSFFLFSLISTISFLIQFIIKIIFLEKYSYNHERLIISAICFIFFYFLHKNISFKNYKKIGSVVYTNYSKPLIKNIFSLIDQYPDFLHVDLIDKTFNKKQENTVDNINYIFKNNKISTTHLHLMSKKPSQYFSKLKKYKIDLIYIHLEIKENLHDVIKEARKIFSKVGIAYMYNIDIKKNKKILKYFDEHLILCIKNPGTSGSEFEPNAFKKIKHINKKFSNVSLCVDGGVNKHIADKLDCEYIVSSSYLLSSPNTIKIIQKLKHNYLD